MDQTPIPQATGAPAPQGGAPDALDPTIVNLAKAIRETETKGQKDPYAAKGASGEFGAYQYTADTWKADAQKYLGKDVPLESADKLTQNEVAYKKLADLKGQGYNVGQIASIWNSGSPEWEGKVGTNSKGVKYDTPQYVDSVTSSYQALKAGKQPNYAPTSSTVGAQPDSGDPLGGKTFSELYGGATGNQGGQGGSGGQNDNSGAMFPAAEGDNPLVSGLKTLGNIPGSAYAFGKGALESLNPITTVQNLLKIPGAFKEAVDANGGDVMKVLQMVAEGTPGEAYRQLVPAFGQKLVAGDLEGARKEVTNNPVGSIAPFVFGAEGLAKGIDTVTGRASADAAASKAAIEAGQPPPPPGGATGAFNSAVSATAAPVINAADRVFGGAVRGAGDMARYAFGQATGLEPSTIKTRIENPKVDMSTLNRGSLGEDVGAALDKRISDLGETGSGYDEIRKNGTPISGNYADFWQTIKDNTGLEHGEDGQWKATADSSIRNAADVAKVQKLYDFWQPIFEKGEMTPSQFLNFRSDLADMAKYDQGFGKSAALDRAAQGMRKDMNASIRPQIDGLAALDDTYSSQIDDLKNLRKGILDKNNNLTDGAVNKIANAVGKGKDQLLARLEEIKPGITKQIELVKMAEDFERAAGTKVGTYTRSMLGAGGFAAGIATANIPVIAASIGEMLIQNPKVADSIIRTYGNSKPLMTAVAAYIRKGTNAVNNLPETPVRSVFGRPQQGLPAGQ